jgi:hypothetical protein
MAVDSTVPGAISAIQGYFGTVAVFNPSLALGIYTGPPIENVANNFLMIGGYPDGAEMVTSYSSTWAVLPAAAKTVTEDYAISCCLRTWAGDSDPTSRLADAFMLLSQIHEQVVTDPSGSGNLSTSGSWGEFGPVSMPICGPFEGVGGWGVVLTFDIRVINVRLTG